MSEISCILQRLMSFMNRKFDYINNKSEGTDNKFEGVNSKSEGINNIFESIKRERKKEVELFNKKLNNITTNFNISWKP